MTNVNVFKLHHTIDHDQTYADRFSYMLWRCIFQCYEELPGGDGNNYKQK